MYYYVIISIFLVFGYSIEYSGEDLKQAKVVEFISTKTINYIDNLKINGDDKYYHFQKLLDAYLENLYVTSNYKCTSKTKAVENLLKDFECVRVINGEKYGDLR